MKTLFSYTTIGAILLTLYLFQEILDIRWPFMEELQANESYKRWSGFALAIFILLQWSLTLARVVKKWNEKSQTINTIHKWLGAISPVFFYVHASHFGFAYLFFLSICFFSNSLIGLLNTDTIKQKADWYLQGWMISHVALSMLISFLMIYHIFIVFYYE